MKQATISITGIAMALLLLATPLRAEDWQMLVGHVPGAVSRLSPVDSLPASMNLRLSIGLHLRNGVSLTNLLRQIYDPTSPNYRHYLTPAQFTDQFGPTKEDYQALISFMQSSGFTVSGEHPNRMLLNVNGTVASIEKAFHTHLRVYQHPKEPRNFYAPDIEPRLYLPVPVSRIGGLDNFVLPHPADLMPTSAGRSVEIEPQGGSVNGNYGSNDFRLAYAPGVTLNGAGQSIGLVEFDGYYTNDITTYESMDGLPNISLTNVLLDNFTGKPGSNNGEVALDIELAVAMAPGLAKVIVYEAGPQGSADDILTRMAEDNLASQISSSWLWGASDDQLADDIFLEFAAQGQSFFNASGDAGAYSGSIPFPADNPFITIVGGTTLTTSQNGSWLSEIVLNPNSGRTSGGGISLRYPIPDWEEGINMTGNQGSPNYRNLPDVALVAQNVWAVYNNGVSSGYNGTSCATPLWAAFTALVNQQAAMYGQPPVGFLNPALSAIGLGTNYAACFHDITTGNNTNSSSPGEFFAGPGYDLCTGWGTPAGQPLINALVPPDYLAVSPQVGFTAYGLPGGPLNPTAQTFVLTNHGPVDLTWSAINTSVWMNVSPAGGTLSAGGQSVEVIVSLAPAAYALPAGIYSAGIFFSNLTSGLAQEREVFLQPGRSLVLNGGFEAGVFLDWSLSGSVLANIVSSGSSIVPHSGNFAAALGQSGALAYLSQTLPTLPGQSYLLSFWLQNPVKGTPNQFQVNWNTNSLGTNTIFNRVNQDVFNWTNLQFLVTAAGSNTVLQFGSRNDPWYYGLDDISVTPIPLPNPSITSTFGSSVSFTWPGFPGLNYQVQYRTNLTQDVWINLGSPIRASNEIVSASDFFGPDPQRFYRVVGSP